jgi:cytochrome c peroxidase
VLPLNRKEKGMLSQRHLSGVHFRSQLFSSAVACALLAACAGAPDDGLFEGEPRDTESTVEIGQAREAINFASASDICSADPRVTLGIVSQAVCVGAELFFRDEFGGNGRSCASCHPASNNYTIDPAFIAELPNSDPLFVAEQVAALNNLEKPTLLRDFGLILENVDGADAPTTKFTMRSVPHCLSLSRSITPPVGTITPPLERTGWSGDGAPNQGRLKDFQTGAIFQHYTKRLNRVAGTDFIQATSDELDAIDAFMKTIGRTNELSLGSVALTDSGAESGRVTFTTPEKRCNGCHNNAGANNASGVNRNFNTGVENARLAVLDTLGIPFDGGFGGAGLTSPNFDTDGDSINDSFGDGTFNTPPLIEAADTGPFFHTNAFETIEDAIAFYISDEFAASPSGSPTIVLSATEIANLGRFLRVLNASFNIQMAIARVTALLPIIADGENQTRDLQQALASLAGEEVDDAVAVLSAKSGLNTAVQADLASAQGFLATASTHSSHTQRGRAAEDALSELNDAKAGLGTGMNFTMGAGTQMF